MSSWEYVNIDCEQSLFSSKTVGKMQNKRGSAERDCDSDGAAASSAVIGRRPKRETALVSYYDLDANR